MYNDYSLLSGVMQESPTKNSHQSFEKCILFNEIFSFDIIIVLKTYTQLKKYLWNPFYMLNAASLVFQKGHLVLEEPLLVKMESAYQLDGSVILMMIVEMDQMKIEPCVVSFFLMLMQTFIIHLF